MNTGKNSKTCSRNLVTTYISRAKVIEEQYEDLRDVKANQHRQQFQAAQEELHEHWFQLEAIFCQTGDPQPLYDLIAQIRTPVQQ